MRARAGVAAPVLSLTLCALAWLLGTAAQLLQPQLWPAGYYQGVLGVAMAMAALRWAHALRSPWWLYLALAAAAAGSAGWRAAHYQAQLLQDAVQGQDLRLTGVVRGLPQWRPDGSRFVFEVEQATTLQGQAVPVPPLLSLGWFVPLQAAGRSAAQDAGCRICVRPGERWQLTARLQQAHGSRNPHGFDLELWLWQQGLGASGTVRAEPAARLLRPASGWQAPVDTARLQVRQRLLAWLQPAPGAAQAALEQRSAGILAALVMGDQSAIDKDDWDIFRLTGVSHLMSISGLHITMFAWLAGGLAGWLWRHSARRGWPLCLWLPAPQAGLWAGAALAWAYALFSGWGIPAQRTVCMLAVVALLRHGGRQWPWHAVLALAAWVVLLLDPWALLQVGFWLSFVAVGILFLSGERAQAVTPGAGWLEHAWAAVRAFAWQQWVVLLALTPLAMLMFGQFSLVGVFANAVAVPLVTLVVTPLAMLGVLLPPLWQPAAGAVQVMVRMLEWMASLPWATYGAALAPQWVGAAGLCGGVLLALRLPLAWRLPGAVLLLPVLSWQAVRPPPGEFDVLMADIGQGGAVLVRTHGRSLLYDAGPAWGQGQDAGQRVLLPLLRALDEQPHMLLLSHTDSDHAGGMAALRAAFPLAQWLGGAEAGHPLRQQGMQPCVAGQHWRWDGVDFEVLHPMPQDYAPGADSNGLSCVLRVANGRRSALLVGDTGVPQEQAMLARVPPALLRADVLLVGHHGSITSTSGDWLRVVQPQYALIQHGYRNRYGHPHPDVLQRLQQHGSQIVQTDQCGAGWWRSAGNSLQCERVVRQRYWQHQVPLPPVRQQGLPAASG